MVKSAASEAEADQILAKPLVMIKFSATWCGPCKAIAPFIDKLEPQFPKVAFVDIDVDKLQSVAQRFSVTAMPTFVFLHMGTESGRVVGGALPQITQNLRALTAKAPSYGSGNRVGGTGNVTEQRTISEIRELRTRAIAKAQERRAESSAEKKSSTPSSAARRSAPTISSGEFLSNLVKYLQLYAVTLFSFDSKAAAAQHSR